jgi:inorganic triphosphatase YgiF
MEIELKLLIRPDDATKLQRSLLVQDNALGAAHRQMLGTAYFDTADLLLQKHAIAWRVRRAGRQWLQAIKGGGNVEAGLHRRHEWESAIAGPEPDPAALHDLLPRRGPWRKIIDKAARIGLVAVFDTRFHRTTRQLAFLDGTRVEMALDQGEIRCGGVVAPISEIELELKAGDARALFEFALALQHEVPFTIGHASKAERGYNAFRPAVAAVAPAPLILARDTVPLNALRSVIGHCLQHMHANAAGVIAGRDGECIHQMRVGLRRLRTALAVFAPVATCPAALRAEIIWLRNALAPAREWDVLAQMLASLQAADSSADTVVPASEQTGQAGMTALQNAVRRAARAHQRRAASAVASPRYTRCILQIGAWLCDLAAQGGPTGGRGRSVSMEKFAARTIRQCRARLCKRGARARAGAPDGWHRLRIAVRRTRYAVEFMMPLLPDKASRTMLASLTKLQELLGRLNDLAVGIRLLAEVAAKRPDMLAPAEYARGVFSAESGQLALRLRKQIRHAL